VVWFAVYGALLLVLFVRVRDPSAAPRRVPMPSVDEPFGLIRWHHRSVYALLVAVVIEALLTTTRTDGRWLGVLAMAAGVGLYRWAGAVLGPALSPFLSPVEGATVVRSGPYKRVRHPMYLGQLLIVVGAPLLLGARYSWILAAVAAGMISARLFLEERRLRRRFAGYEAYVRGTKRLLPWIL
jgi:protein-S-isoprenylcysteine O-methyltransferase Ste14